jgi:uncharacterized repeat protein (TIGR03803 family)
MKRRQFVAPIWCALVLAQSAVAQVTFLHLFTGSDGGEPNAPGPGLLASATKFYGTTFAGGSKNDGTVFSINSDGSDFQSHHSFTGFALSGADGRFPVAGLTISGNTLYGTTLEGGASAVGGTVFAINTDGSGYHPIHSFVTSSSGG